MVQTDPVNLIYTGNADQAETVSVAVVGENTNFGVQYFINNQGPTTLAEGDKIIIPFAKSKRIRLRMFFHFSDPSGTGGIYHVTTKGSKGGNFIRRWIQMGSDPQIRTYKFDA